MTRTGNGASDDRGASGAIPHGASTRAWLPLAGLVLALLLAWVNYLTAARWADLPGALRGWKAPWYAAALLAATAFTLAGRRRVGQPVKIRLTPVVAVLLAGAALMVAAFLCRHPPSVWSEIPFKDDWTELFQQASNGVALLRRGVVVGWNWWFLGGYPTSTDIAQNFGILAFVPMTLLGDRLGYHVLHAAMFMAVPLFVWLDLRHEDRETCLLATGLACFFAAGYSGPLGSSGDTNSLVGVCGAALALVGSHEARRGGRWGGPALLLGLTLTLYTHAAYFVYSAIFLTIEAIYFHDRRALMRLAVAGGLAGLVSLPTHWESLRYPAYVSFNNTVYTPGAPIDWPRLVRAVYYTVEILALPNRWYNDYRSLANVWLPVLAVTAVLPGRSRTSFYAWMAVVAQLLLRINTPEAGAMFERIHHIFPLLTAPALAGFVVRCAGTRAIALAVLALLALYVHTAFTPIRHVPELRAFDPPLIDRIAASDGNLVLVEVSPHRDMDSDPARRTPPTPFDVHFEGLLPGLKGQRFYSQMIDGWVWNIHRGQVVGAGTFAGKAIAETPPEAFDAEMTRWGVRHLFVWTDASRDYLAASGRFVERWRGGRWSHFERPGADTRSVVTSSGQGALRNLDFLGADVELTGLKAGDPIVVRANYYPAWRAKDGDADVALEAIGGQLAFRAPRDGSYTVRLEYPRYRGVSALAIAALVTGLVLLRRWPGPTTWPARAIRGVTRFEG
jgi:hypothetical protein